MRTSTDMTKAEARFVDDTKHGYLVSSSCCKEIFEYKNSDGECCYCPICKEELFYRPWWEW